MIKRFLLFLLINFAGLALSGLFTGKGVPSAWYQDLVKAPWTPPGWVFGFAWTVIMISFALYMAFLLDRSDRINKLLLLFGLQFILNNLWSPVFFHFRMPLTGLFIIFLLTLVVGYLFFSYRARLQWKSLLILPYLLWLILATSLNAYIVVFNYNS
jgi:tryptophan-rich sensory protein